MSSRWFGVPRWAVIGAVFGVFACIGVYAEPAKVSDDVRAVVEGFRHGSVYVEQGAPPVVNADRVRQVLGDRPIVVAILADRLLPPTDSDLVRPRQQFCSDVAKQVPTNEVIVFGGDAKDGYGSSFCTGDKFSNADNPVKAGNFDFPLVAAAETAWKYRVSATDMTPKVEEYVLAFDAQAAKDYPRSVPRRGAVPDELATGEVVLSLGGIVAATIAIFFLLSLLGKLVGREPKRRRRQLELSTRLSRIGEYVLETNPQQDKQAEVSRRYVLALHALEAGEDAEPRIKELEEMVR